MGLNRLLPVLLVAVGLSSPIFIVHAATYTPGVSAGQWAKYQTLYDRCQSSDPMQCQSQGSGGLNDTDFGLIQVLGVSGTTVTFRLFTQYKNGTTSTVGAQVDVYSGYSNITSFNSGVPSDYFIIAAGLSAGDHIWYPSTSPTLNQTTTEQVAGVSRQVNVLNYTITSAYPPYYTSSSSFQFSFDQASGLFVEFSYSISSTSQFGSTQTSMQSSAAFGMVDNNVWLSSSLPDFSIGSIQPMTFETGSSGTATVAFTAQSGFSSSIRLSINAPSGLTCSFDHTTIKGSGTATLTCNGQPGTYTVTIKASSGYSTHSAPTTVTVKAANAPSQPTNGLPLTYIYIGAAIAAVVVIGVAFFLIRRKPVAPVPPPTVSTPPAASPPA